MIQQYLVSYELASANLETLLFDKVAEIREDKPGGEEGDQAGRLNGEDSARITGTSILLKVMAGDQVALQAFNYYEGYDSAEDTPLSPGAVLQSIVTTLTGGAGGLEDGESHDPGMVPKMFTVGNYTAFDNIVQGITDSSRPRAYLNYVLFDNRMKLVAEGSGSFQVNGDGQWGVIGTNGTPLVIPENGYIGIYTVNGSRGNVWFDQIKILVTQSRLKEENHYYPFGLPMGHMGSAAAGMIENRRKYQSNEYIKDAGLNWMDFNFRQYDPQIGRFMSVDPLAGSTDMISPYAAMGNAPESLTDPTGLQPGPSPKISVAGVGSGLIDYSMSATYAMMLQINADLVRMGMDPIGDFGGGGGGSWSGGASSGQVFYLEGEAAQIFWEAFVGGATITFFNGTNSFAVNYPGGGGASGGGSSGFKWSSASVNMGYLPDFDGGISDGDGGCKNCPVGPFEDNPNRGDGIPESKAWDLNGDGIFSRNEMVYWRENGNGRAVEVNAGSINIGYIDTKNLQDNQIISIKLLTFNRGMNSQGRVYGELALMYHKNQGGFSILPNMNNYETGAEHGFPRSERYIRNSLTELGKYIDGGRNGGVDFMIFFRGLVYPLCPVK